jgi:hypothetical protein
MTDVYEMLPTMISSAVANTLYLYASIMASDTLSTTGMFYFILFLFIFFLLYIYIYMCVSMYIYMYICINIYLVLKVMW